MKITEDDRLKLLALWTLATQHYAEARKFEFAMRRMLTDEVFDQRRDRSRGWL